MQKYLLKIIWNSGRFISFFISYKTRRFYTRIKDRFITAIISREFKSFAVDSVVQDGFYVIGAKYISIGEKTNIGKRGVITAWDSFENKQYKPEIIIGNFVSIGADCHITSINKIFIGNNVLTGTKVTITDNSHGRFSVKDLKIPPELRNLESDGPVIIEDNVWIGDKVTILPNVTIGKNSIIGANSVVTKNIPSNSVAVGIPAKVIKSLRNE